MSEISVPGLDPVAAQRWQRLPRSSSSWLHEEVASRMAERLDWILQRPKDWLHWNAVLGGLQAHLALQARYPEAQAHLGGRQAAGAAEWLVRQGSRRWGLLRRWASRPPVHGIENGLPSSGFDMVWANMALPAEPMPQVLLRQWLAALRPGGFLMFSSLGPDTLQELHRVYERMGWPPPAAACTDMHDWGDMLVEAGYAEPVMEMERLTFTYPDARRLLRDLREAGRNLALQRYAGCRGKAWQQALLDALERDLPRTEQGHLMLTVEVLYGHAHKGQTVRARGSEAAFSVDDMKTLLRATR